MGNRQAGPCGRTMSDERPAAISTQEGQATAVAKANIRIVTLVVFAIIGFGNWGFGLWWLLVIVLLWIAVALIVAPSFTYLRIAAVERFGKNDKAARFAANSVDLFNYIVLGLATYYGLWYL